MKRGVPKSAMERTKVSSAAVEIAGVRIGSVIVKSRFVGEGPFLLFGSALIFLDFFLSPFIARYCT